MSESLKKITDVLGIQLYDPSSVWKKTGRSYTRNVCDFFFLKILTFLMLIIFLSIKSVIHFQVSLKGGGYWVGEFNESFCFQRVFKGYGERE